MAVVFGHNAEVAKLVDAHVSGACGAIHGGSSPLPGTNLGHLDRGFNNQICPGGEIGRRAVLRRL